MDVGVVFTLIRRSGRESWRWDEKSLIPNAQRLLGENAHVPIQDALWFTFKLRQSGLSTFCSLHCKTKIYIACVWVQLDCSSNSVKIFTVLRSEHKAFLSVHLCLPLHACKYEQLEKIMGICQQVYLHGAARLKQYMFVISPGVKIHHYLFLARDEVLQTSASQSWSFATLCKGTSSSFFTCCTHSKILDLQNKSVWRI